MQKKSVVTTEDITQLSGSGVAACFLPRVGMMSGEK